MMKRKLFAALIGSLGFLFVGAFALWCPNLPPGNVSTTYTHPGAATNSFFTISFTGIPAGYDIQNSPVVYPGWCIEDNHMSNSSAVTMYCSLDPGLPSNLQPSTGNNWNMVNYLLNNKTGTWQEVQAALWMLIWGSSSYPVTPTAQSMITNALANGSFIPSTGQVVAVILYTGDGIGIGNGGSQETIIEVLVPGQGEGCTPGFWKNHLEDWAATGYSPSDDFDTIFGTNYFEPNITLGQALWLRGGGIDKCGRQAVAALLSASHPDVDYPYTVAQVIAIVQAGCAQIDLLVDANELGCFIPERR